MEACYYCGTPLAARRVERDHFPIPKSCGGTQTVPACQPCHDLKDRIDWRDIPVEMKADFLADVDQMGRTGKIMLGKMLAAWYQMDRIRRGEQRIDRITFTGTDGPALQCTLDGPGLHLVMTGDERTARDWLANLARAVELMNPKESDGA